MGISKKIANAKEVNWLTKGFTDSEVKTTIELARISAQIERCRLNMGMSQQEFAKYLGVSQGMISKWESREYNFTIKALNEICEQLGMDLSISLSKPSVSSGYEVIKWNEEKRKKRKSNMSSWKKLTFDGEAIA